MGGLLNRPRGGGGRRGGGGGRDEYIGREIRIHGNPYTFQRLLGVGGFGAVYAARASNGANVAIKVIEIDRSGVGPVLVDSYLNEVRHLERLRLQSRHVVRIYDFDFDGRSGRSYIVMELGGENLTKLIERSRETHRGPSGSGSYTDPVLRQEAWRQLVSIVRTLTANRIVHLDLKPDNIIAFGRTLKIADLGISKKADMLGQPGVGTPWFSAPEVMQDRSSVGQYYGPKADVWSLGAILYYMTYGQPPNYSHQAADPPPGQLPTSDRALADILRRMLVANPHHRADISAALRHPYTTRR